MTVKEDLIFRIASNEEIRENMIFTTDVRVPKCNFLYAVRDAEEAIV